MSADTATMAGGSSAQTAIPRRRFRLLDAMILTAATAVACGFVRWTKLATDFSWLVLAGELLKPFQAASSHGSSAKAWIDVLMRANIIPALLAIPFVTMWTLALIPIRLLGPRPRFLRLARQPGMMATCTVGVAMAFLGLPIVALAPFLGWEARRWLGLAQDAWLFLPFVYFGLAVLVSWTTLLLGRRWRAESSWIDRLGRAVGVFWVVEGLIVPVVFALAQ